MVYIKDNHIIEFDRSSNKFVSISHAKYYPLCVYSDIILMSDSRLYVCYEHAPHSYYLLCKLKIGGSSDYVVTDADFTDEFVKIKSDYYKIDSKLLVKIPIIAKNSSNIVKSYDDYYYVNMDDQLVQFKCKHSSHTILDSCVESLFLCRRHCETIHIVYKKLNKIISSVYSNKYLALLHTSVIDCDNFSVIKYQDLYLLGSNDNLYKLILSYNDCRCKLKSIVCEISDFNIYITDLFILSANTNVMHRTKTYDFNVKKYVDDDHCHFRKKLCNVKSAKNYENKINT
jgi:hypothetical protein